MSTSPAPTRSRIVGVRPLAARRVDVHARDARRREAVGEQTLHLLRPESALPQHEPLAARTRGSHRLGVQTVVADQPLRRSMIRETDRAVRTGRDVAAVGALNERRVAAPIEQENALLALRQPIGQRLLELLADDEPQPVGRVARSQPVATRAAVPPGGR